MCFKCHTKKELRSVKKQLTLIEKNLATLGEFLIIINQKLDNNMANLKNLEAAVARETAIDQSVLSLITGLVEQIKAAGIDQAKLDALTDKLTSNADALAAAVAQNTPSAPPAETPSTPVETTPATPAEGTPASDGSAAGTDGSADAGTSTDGSAEAGSTTDGNG